jgi:hypothetical protein
VGWYLESAVTSAESEYDHLLSPGDWCMLFWSYPRWLFLHLVLRTAFTVILASL